MEFSIIWALIISLITLFLFLLFYLIIKNKKHLSLLFCFYCTFFVYSGIGISFNTVDKINIIYYMFFLIVLSIVYTIICKTRIRTSSYQKSDYNKINYMESNLAKGFFTFFMCLYIALRLFSLVYPVNHLANLSLVYDSSNNIQNLLGENTSLIQTLASIIMPFFYIGMFYNFKKVRSIVFLLSIDSLIKLIITGYLSRHEIVSIVIICSFLYISGTLNKGYENLSKEKRRLFFTVITILPILAYVMVELMETRISSGTKYSIITMIEKEISFPKSYQKIVDMSPLVNKKDYFLQLLDTFVPILPTPKHEMNLNVTYSKRMLGYGLSTPGFSIKLPSLLGESFLIFGNNLFWIHAIIIAIMMGMINKLTSDKHLKILRLYYIVSILKCGRAGYEELSQTILLNFVVVAGAIFVIRELFNKSYGKKY